MNTQPRCGLLRLFILFFCLTFTVGISAQDNRTVLAIDTVPGTYGASVTVPIRVTPAKALYSFKLDVTYDSLKLEYRGPGTVNTLLQNFGSVSINRSAPGLVQISAEAQNGKSITSAGVLIELAFRITAITTEAALINITNPSGDLAGANVIGGKVLIGSGQPYSTPTPFSFPTFPVYPSPTLTSYATCTSTPLLFPSFTPFSYFTPTPYIFPTLTPFGKPTPSITPTSIGYHAADGDHNGVIDDFELLTFINRWVNKQTSDLDLLFAIQLWACPKGYQSNGTGGWICR